MWRILIAEDDLKSCQQMTSRFNSIAKCKIVHDGESALEAYYQSIQTNNPFDFILLDVSMPIIDGFEVLQNIRAEEQKNNPDKEVIIIMITSYGETLLDKINFGWDDYISKPVDTEILLKHMTKLMDL